MAFCGPSMNDRWQCWQKKVRKKGKSVSRYIYHIWIPIIHMYLASPSMMIGIQYIQLPLRGWLVPLKNSAMLGAKCWLLLWKSFILNSSHVRLSKEGPFCGPTAQLQSLMPHLRYKWVHCDRHPSHRSSCHFIHESSQVHWPSLFPRLSCHQVSNYFSLRPSLASQAHNSKHICL